MLQLANTAALSLMDIFLLCVFSHNMMTYGEASRTQFVGFNTGGGIILHQYKNKFGFFICQVHGFLSGLNYSLEPQKKKSMPPGLFTDTPIRHSSYTFSCLVCCLCPLPIRAPFGLNSYQEANGNGKALHTGGNKFFLCVVTHTIFFIWCSWCISFFQLL